ncbi:MAG TPA: hypothetical protein VKF63_07515 [Terracidiphilus sp.]|nr:hypothetical protein [Terracidiphilus sp.]
MREGLCQTVEHVNARLAALIENARRALRGEGEFNAEDVRKLREPVEEMAPIVAQSPDLRQAQPEIIGQLDQYKSHLGELQTTLNQLRVMLLARQASLCSDQTHVSAVSRWASALRQTR